MSDENLITTANNLEGYTISKHLGIVQALQLEAGAL